MPVKNLKTDILIIGAGPAGLTAGLYVARAGKKAIILEGRATSRLAVNYALENYPGFLSVGSRELLVKMREQATHFGAEILDGDAIAFALDGRPKYVTTKDAVIESGAVILATGKPVPKDRLIAGEEKLLGQGVSYCATCDGPLFRNASVAAVGHSKEAMEDVLALHELNCRVTWIPEKARPSLDAASVASIENKGVVIRWDAKVREIIGDQRVERIAVVTPGGVEEIPVAAVFIFREIPAGLLLSRAGLAVDHKQCIAVDRYQRTSVPGVFAAGDVTCGGLQVVAAAGEGCVAALQALTYLRK